MKREMLLRIIARDLSGLSVELADVALAFEEEAKEAEEWRRRRKEAQERGEPLEPMAGVPTGPTQEEQVMMHASERLMGLVKLLTPPRRA